MQDHAKTAAVAAGNGNAGKVCIFLGNGGNCSSMNRHTSPTKPDRQIHAARTAVIVIIAVAAFFLLLEYQEFVHLATRLFYWSR